jgi:diguanylate cyclase (GGDEF)-like protein
MTIELAEHPKLVLALGVVLVVIVGLLDYVTGIELSFSIFYLVPVTIVAWYGLNWMAVVVAALSAVIWLKADLMGQHSYSKNWIPYWNALVRLGYFSLGIFYIRKIKKILLLEATLNRSDFLTGVSTNRAFYELLEREKHRCLRNGKPLTIAYLDCDNFKAINDSLGHQAGDTLLRSVGQSLQNSLRKTDIVARLGGDEFAVALPECNEQAAIETLTRLRQKLLDIMRDNNWPVTFSIGIVTFINTSKSVDELIKQADNLMYVVKKDTKNMIKHEVIHD